MWGGRHCWLDILLGKNEHGGQTGRGVAGAQPLHKGGRLRPTAQMKVMRREGTLLLASYWFAIQLRLRSSDICIYGYRQDQSLDGGGVDRTRHQ